jgi:hypothetical protein
MAKLYERCAAAWPAFVMYPCHRHSINYITLLTMPSAHVQFTSMHLYLRQTKSELSTHRCHCACRCKMHALSQCTLSRAHFPFVVVFPYCSIYVFVLLVLREVYCPHTPRRRYLYFAIFSLQAGARFPFVASPLRHQTCLTSSACAPAWASLPTSFYHGCPTYTHVCTHTLVMWKQS